MKVLKRYKWTISTTSATAISLVLALSFGSYFWLPVLGLAYVWAIVLYRLCGGR